MNLKQLKKMIAEEYSAYTEQVGEPVGAPGMPGIEVGPNDIDAMGDGKDSEDTLRQIYDMLKAYFEGGAAGAPAAMPAGGDNMDMDMDMDMDAAEDMEDEEEEEEEEEEVSEEKEKKDSKKEAKELKERFKKLANIIKG